MIRNKEAARVFIQAGYSRFNHDARFNGGKMISAISRLARRSGVDAEPVMQGGDFIQGELPLPWKHLTLAIRPNGFPILPQCRPIFSFRASLTVKSLFDNHGRSINKNYAGRQKRDLRITQQRMTL